jgi:hypothetical protein
MEKNIERKLDAGESRAKKFLEFIRPNEEIIHLGKKNQPPDFALSNVAVEVTRLLKLHHDGSQLDKLTKLKAPLLINFHSFISKYDLSGKSNCSYLVYYIFRRPLKIDRESINRKLQCKLDKFFLMPLSENICLNIDDNLTIRLYKDDLTYPPQLIEAGYSDLDDSGFFIKDMAESMNYCMAEKTNKVKDLYKEYPEWWLVLINHLPFAVDGTEFIQIQKYISPKGIWSRIFVVDPIDPTKYFEVN